MTARNSSVKGKPVSASVSSSQSRRAQARGEEQHHQHDESQRAADAAQMIEDERSCVEGPVAEGARGAEFSGPDLRARHRLADVIGPEFLACQPYRGQDDGGDQQPC